MNYKTRVWKQIRENSPLRLKLALALGISEAGVLKAAKSKSDSLTRYAAVKVISKELNIPKEELFETELENHQ